MCSEDYEEASFESEPGHDAETAPHAEAAAAAPVALSDNELDAYLAADETAQTVSKTHAAGSIVDHLHGDVQLQEVDSKLPQVASPKTQGSSNSVEGNKPQPTDNAVIFVEQSLADDSSDVEHIDSQDAGEASLSSVGAEHSQHTQQLQEQPYAAVALAPQPNIHAIGPDAGGFASTQNSREAGSISAAASSQRSSMHSSKHESAAGNHVPNDQERQELWNVAGLPGTTSSDQQLAPNHSSCTPGGFGAAAVAEEDTDGSMLRALQDNSLGIGYAVQKAKLRPASASPIVRRSSSTLQQHPAFDQEHICSPSSSSSPSNSRWHEEAAVIPVAGWTVNDVCDWVDGLGLCQYRKKFMHHVVDGRLLLRLTDTLLRTELGIGPLGHRVLILDGVEAIANADLQQAAGAALSGTSPEDFQASTSCGSASAAAALLVAGLIGLKAGQRISGGSFSPGLVRTGSGKLTGSPAYTPVAAAGGSLERQSTNSLSGHRARPFSAPCRGKVRERSASPAGGRASPSPGALGPAAGRISVYEQRSKILFELSRAQARAAATAGAATEVAGVAKLAQKEVAMLQGQLADLDQKNKLAVQHAGGSVDSRGIIPWQHVGNGTKAADPHPERIARPWDSPDMEMTFQPRISAKSKRLMAESRGNDSAAGFLDRLNHDLQRREAKQRDLEKRYYNNAAGAEAANAGKAAAADLAVVTTFFSQRGWATLTVPGSNSSGTASSGLTEADYRELDNQLDEVIETYSEELGLGKSDSKHSHAILAERGPKKLAAVVAAVRTQQFMDRYHADLNSRGSRLQQLQDTWFKQQLSSTSHPGRPAAVPLTPEQKDLAQAVQWFKSMGWEEAAESDDCDELISALVKRARHCKTEAERLHDKERAAAGGAPAATTTHSTTLPHPSINWSSSPWSADGLGPLMQAVLDARKAAADAAAQRAAAAKPSAVDAALKDSGKQAGATAAAANNGMSTGDTNSSTAAAATLEAAAASGANTLDLSVRLLAGMQWAGLDQLDAASNKTKKLAVYRALRTQQFLAFTAADLANRETKQRALLAQFEASRRGKLVSKAELDDFYQRLQADGERRKVELDKARTQKAEREAKALALVSVGPGFSRRPRPHSAKA